MKKIFGMTLAILLLTLNAAHAAKFPVLAEIDAENFFRNMGYEVDCSYWKRTRDGRLLFEANLPEDPLIISKEFGNVEVYTDKKNRIVELRLFMQKGSEASEMAAIVARAIKALDADAFAANQADIEQNIFRLMSSPQLPDDAELTVNADKKFFLHKEELRGRILTVHITAA